MPFSRKNIRFNAAKYIGQSSYFITMCCSGRSPVFKDGPNAESLIETLRKHSVTHRFAVQAYCVMPDHIHLLVTGLDPASDLLALVKNVKQTTSAEHQRTFHRELWQKKFYDHILRERDNAAGVAGYIWMNPVRAGICTEPRNYPHSGSFTMDWKSAITPTESWAPGWKKSETPLK